MKSSRFIGQTLSNRYQIQQQIGSGGFASVFKARDVVQNKDVAVKILTQKSDTQTNEKREERFSREARIHLNHPNIVQIIEYNHHESPSCTYIVMELLSGHDLRKELEDHGPINPKRAIRFMIQALEGLENAHQQNIIHRDIKPENLFIHIQNKSDENIKLLDFGIARMHSEHTLSLTGQLLGTHKYLAPEYIQDNNITPRLDIYQMGLVLIELLVGKPVVHTDHAMTGLRQHIRGSLEVPMALLESSLGPIIVQSLHNNPNERFSSALQFAKALSSISPDELPFGEQLTETISLDVYQKSSSLMEISSEEEIESAKKTTVHDAGNQKNIYILIIVLLAVIIGLAIVMIQY